MTKEEIALQKVQVTKDLVLALIAKGHVGTSSINPIFNSIYQMVDSLMKED